MESYETLAMELAQRPDILRDLKARLTSGRGSQPLFDTARFTRNLERDYLAMWERYQKGDPPVRFCVGPAEG